MTNWKIYGEVKYELIYFYFLTIIKLNTLYSDRNNSFIETKFRRKCLRCEVDNNISLS